MPAKGGSAYSGKNKIFAYTILGLNVIATWASWWVLRRAFLGESTHSWIYPTLAFSLWGIVFALAVMFVRNWKLQFASFVLGFVVYPFFLGFNLSIVGALITFGLFLLTENQAKKEIAQGIHLNFYRLVGHTLKYFVTAVCMVVAVAYYFHLLERSAVPSPIFLEDETLQAEMDFGLKTAGFVLPEEKRAIIDDITSGMSVDDFLSKNFVQPEVDETILNSDSAPGIAKVIGDTAAVEVQQKLLAKSKKDLSKQLGVDVVGELPMKNVLMSYIDKTERSFFEYSGTDKFYVPIIIAIGIFLTARVLGTIVEIFLGLVILLIIKMLEKTGLIEMVREQREVMTIRYDV